MSFPCHTCGAELTPGLRLKPAVLFRDSFQAIEAFTYPKKRRIEE